VRLRSGHEAVLLVTHADASAALADTRLSHDLTAAGAPRLAPGGSFRDDPDIILNLDGDKHRRFRRIMAGAFTPRNVERWRPRIRAVAEELVDDIEQAGPPADLAETYCAVLPYRVFCALLGLEIDDIPRFHVWSDAFALATPITPEERAQRMKEFEVYIGRLIAHRRAEPGHDLIDDLIAARDGADRLTESELPYLVMALIVGGTQTTSIALGRSLLDLLRDDAVLWQRIVVDSRLIPSAVDELLRVNVIGDLLQLRVAVDDVELPSGTVRKGDAVVVAVRSATTDESVYDDPLTVRFGREIREPLYFGAGPHFCIGSHLAKAELQVAIQVLAERLPGLSLAVGLDGVRFTEGAELSSLASLPVRW
jgi:cytochrome P450